MMISLFSKRFAPDAPGVSRATLKRGYVVLHTVDPASPDGALMDPETGVIYPSAAAAVPAGWEEVFRCDYFPGRTAASKQRRVSHGRREVFPHEVVLADPNRFDVVVWPDSVPRGAIALWSSIPAWLVERRG